MSYAEVRRGRMAADKVEGRFTRINNDLFRDHRLTGTAKAVFGLISTHRDGYGISVESLCSDGTRPGMKEGPSAVKAALRCLEKYGYLIRCRERNEDGTWGKSYYEITDMPDGFELRIEAPTPDIEPEDPAQTRRSEPEVENPPVDNPPADEPPVANRPYKKTNRKNHQAKNDSPGSFAGAQEPAGQPPVQETLDGIPDPATPPQLTVLPGGQPEPSIDQQARTIADRYWAWLKEQDVPAPAANDRGRGTPYVKFVSMVRGRLKNGWARVEIENALIDLFDNRNKAFPAAGVLDEKLVERRRGRTGGKSRRVMYRDEQWDDPALLAEVEQWNQESAYGRTRPTVPAMTDEELQAAWDELGAPRREANR